MRSDHSNLCSFFDWKDTIIFKKYKGILCNFFADLFFFLISHCFFQFFNFTIWILK